MRKKIYFYYPNIINDGVKRTFEVYYNYLKKKYNVILITNSNKKIIKNISKIKIIEPEFNFIKKFKILNSILCTIKIIFLKQRKDIIFSLDNHFYLLILKLIGFNFKLIIRTPNPIFNIYNKHELKFFKNKGFTNKFEIYFYKLADLVITYSKQNQLSLIKKFQVKNAEHVNNFFEKKRPLKKIKKKQYNIFFIGRYVVSKDPIFYLKNMIKLFNKVNIKVYLLGEGYLNPELKSIAKNYKKNIKFLKFTNNPFKKYQKKIDLLCVTSKFDGTPNVLGEAIAYSVPCVAPKHVGLANLLLDNGKSGYLYSQGNDKSFQSKVILALKNYKFTIKKTKIALKGLESFSKKKTLSKLDYLISKI